MLDIVKYTRAPQISSAAAYSRARILKPHIRAKPTHAAPAGAPIIKYPHMPRICPDALDACAYTVDNHRMKIFPRAILRMKNLQHLTISAAISRLPARINKLPLKIFNFGGNQLLRVPKQFGKLELIMVNLSGNPLKKLYICADTVQMLDIRKTKLKVFPPVSKAASKVWAGSTDILYWPRTTAAFNRHFKIYLHERTYVPRGIRSRIKYTGV